MTHAKLNYEHIVVDVEGIYLDGVMINTDAVKASVVVNHGGGDEASPTITLTINADLITVSDRMKYLASQTGSVTEIPEGVSARAAEALKTIEGMTFNEMDGLARLGWRV